MISKVAVTHQMDDYALAARELSEQILGGDALKTNSAGILMCYSDMEVENFVAELKGLLSFEVVGCACVASMDGGEGFHEMAATLLVLSADDCAFSVGVSEPVAPGNVAGRVAKTYAEVASGLHGAPKLLVAILPYSLDIMLDEFTLAFNEVAEGIPVVGGLPSHTGSDDANVTISRGQVYRDRLVLLGISGNVRPVFSVQNVTASTVELKRKVTKARDNTVYRVGNQTFVEYMREIGFPLDSLTGADTVTFVSNPLLLENVKMQGGDDFTFVRTLHKIDIDEGSGTAIGMIPESATLSICSLDRKDIETAAGTGMRDLQEKMARVEKEGYAFSTVFAVSCIGRYLLMSPQGETETKGLLAELPQGISLAGFYGYGEIGPLPWGDTAVMNFAHNESLVLCAL